MCECQNCRPLTLHVMFYMILVWMFNANSLNYSLPFNSAAVQLPNSERFWCCKLNYYRLISISKLVIFALSFVWGQELLFKCSPSKIAIAIFFFHCVLHAVCAVSDTNLTCSLCARTLKSSAPASKLRSASLLTRWKYLAVPINDLKVKLFFFLSSLCIIILLQISTCKKTTALWSFSFFFW